jgi:hypothetical protein
MSLQVKWNHVPSLCFLELLRLSVHQAYIFQLQSNPSLRLIDHGPFHGVYLSSSPYLMSQLTC